MRNILTIFTVFTCLFLSHANAETRQGVEHTIQVANNYVSAHKWHEAFEALRTEEAAIGNGHPALLYLIYKQRYRMYSHINKDAEVRGNLARMESLAYKSNDVATIEDMLLVKAYYWNKAGKPAVSQQCYRAYFNIRAKGKTGDELEQCFQQTISEAKQKKLPALAADVQKLYTAWQDSIATAKSAAALRELQKKYKASVADNDSKDSKITALWMTISILSIIAIALAAALIFFIFLKVRSVLTVKKLKKSLELANTSSDRKSVFIRNISQQIMPSLQQMEFGNVKVQINALKKMLAHVEEYMKLESTREERYPVKDIDVLKICQKTCEDVTTEDTPVSTSDTQSQLFPVNAEALEYVLKSVIIEMKAMEGINHISLTFKKRNATMGNFVITAVGPKIPASDQDNIFTAFAKVYDLTKTDGLTLPTCALVAYKMGGNIYLEKDFAKGTRIVLEVRK